MFIDLRQAQDPSGLSLQRYAISFCGHPLDERGKTAVNELSKHSARIHKIWYDGHSMALTIDGQPAEPPELLNIVASANDGPIALETTTLGLRRGSDVLSRGPQSRRPP